MSFILGHRGYSGKYPENTLIAFKKAIEIGCDGIELDVHLTADHHLVVCHDFLVNRTTDGSGPIKNKTLRELQKLDAGSWFHEDFASETIPTLREVLDLIKGTDCLINIELKSGSRIYPGIEEQAVSLVRSYGLMDQTYFSSFDHEAMVKVREINSLAYTGLLYVCCLIEPWHYAKKLKANALHPHYLTVTDDLVGECNKHALDINTYTVNELDEIKKFSEMGLNAIITNYPNLIHAL